MPSDVDQVVSAARAADPSLDAESAAELALRALVLADDLDAAALARTLLADDEGYDVSWVNAVAKATVDLLAGDGT
jgi:hypothetical protein